MALPSLPALRMFEVAGRLSSFTRAATELNVTQAAGQPSDPRARGTARRALVSSYDASARLDAGRVSGCYRG